MAPFILSLASVLGVVGIWVVARAVRARADARGVDVGGWETTALVLLSLLGGGLAGLFGPAGVVQLLYPGSTSYEDVLIYWVVSVPGVPLVLNIVVLRTVGALGRREHPVRRIPDDGATE